jgi:hypothetical protein
LLEREAQPTGLNGEHTAGGANAQGRIAVAPGTSEQSPIAFTFRQAAQDGVNEEPLDAAIGPVKQRFRLHWPRLAIRPDEDELSRRSCQATRQRDTERKRLKT